MKEYFVPKWLNIMLEIIGIILSVLSLTLVFHLSYMFFFEHNKYRRKKDFLKYLNGLDLDTIYTKFLYTSHGLSYSFKINDNFRFTYFSKNGWAVYLNDEIYCTDFYFGLESSFTNKKIKNKLIEIQKTKYKEFFETRLTLWDIETKKFLPIKEVQNFIVLTSFMNILDYLKLVSCILDFIDEEIIVQKLIEVNNHYTYQVYNNNINKTVINMIGEIK